MSLSPNNSSNGFLIFWFEFGDLVQKKHRRNSRVFFLTFWDVMGNPMNGTENNDKTIKTKNNVFQGPFHFFWGDFGGLILYLGFLGLNLEIWSTQKKQMRKKEKERAKKEEKVDCLQGPNPVLPQGEGPLGGTFAILF